MDRYHLRAVTSFHIINEGPCEDSLNQKRPDEVHTSHRYNVLKRLKVSNSTPSMSFMVRSIAAVIMVGERGSHDSYNLGHM